MQACNPAPVSYFWWPIIMRVCSATILLVCSLSFLCSCATRRAQSLPPEVRMNPAAGRGDILIVKLRMADDTEVPFCLDTGSSGTAIDISLASKLGQPVGQ